MPPSFFGFFSQPQRRMSRTEDDDGMIEDSGDGEHYMDDPNRDAGSDPADEDLSGDDLEIHRAPKKQKLDQ
jgi:hypothetical protein